MRSVEPARAASCRNVNGPGRHTSGTMQHDPINIRARTWLMFVEHAHTPDFEFSGGCPVCGPVASFSVVLWIKTESIKQRETEREKERERERASFHHATISKS